MFASLSSLCLCLSVSLPLSRRCEWLDKQNTIFGKIVGETIYNLLRLNDLEASAALHWLRCIAVALVSLHCCFNMCVCSQPWLPAVMIVCTPCRLDMEVTAAAHCRLLYSRHAVLLLRCLHAREPAGCWHSRHTHRTRRQRVPTLNNPKLCAATQVDEATDRPADPPVITSAEVLWNPFDDIVPRTTPAERRAQQQFK